LKAIPVFAAALVLAAVACRKPSPQAWSCNNPQRNACSEWSTTVASVDPGKQASCADMGGTFANAPCPDANVIGSCAAAGGGSRIVYYAPREKSDAEQSCKMLGGTWR
jgi:hypothetical protein